MHYLIIQVGGNEAAKDLNDLRKVLHETVQTKHMRVGDVVIRSDRDTDALGNPLYDEYRTIHRFYEARANLYRQARARQRDQRANREARRSEGTGSAEVTINADANPFIEAAEASREELRTRWGFAEIAAQESPNFPEMIEATVTFNRVDQELLDLLTGRAESGGITSSGSPALRLRDARGRFASRASGTSREAVPTTPTTTRSTPTASSDTYYLTWEVWEASGFQDSLIRADLSLCERHCAQGTFASADGACCTSCHRDNLIIRRDAAEDRARALLDQEV